MKKLIRLIVILVISCSGFLSDMNGQKLERHKAISAYIYNFAKNVEWENEEAIKEFHFLVISEDENIIQEMRTLSQTKTIGNKPIRISSSLVLGSIDNVQLIFISKDKEDSHVEVFDRIEGKNILLVSDNYRDKRLIMINFIESDKGTLRFEINKANIINQRLHVKEDMILLGGTTVDVAALYREGQQSLRSLQKRNENLESNLRRLENDIAAKIQEIEIAKDSLNKQIQKSKAQQKILDIQSQEIKEREKDLENQKDDLTRGDQLLQEQKGKIDNQKSEITYQSKILEEQSGTIQRQQRYVYLLIIIAVLALLLMIAVYTGYRNKQKINKELEVKVQERTNELHNANKQLQIELIERKNTEVRLAESEQKYRELVEHANSIILRWTSTGQITFLNEFGLKFFGYSAEEILGRHVVGTIVPITDSSGNELRQLMEQICANPRAYEQNINENIRRNGERVWIAWTNRIVLDTQGQVVEIFSIGADITERKHAEEALKESEAHYRYLFEQNPVPMLIYEIGSLSMLAINDAFAAHYGYSKIEASKLHLTDLYPESEKKAITDLSNRLQGHAYVGEWHHLKKDGTLLTIEAHSHGFSYEGRNARIAVITDITERKQAEEEIKKANRVYAVLSNINQAIVHVKDKETLFNEACRIAVEDGKFRMAWVGIVSPQTNKVSPVASAGFAEDYLKTINIDLNDEKLGQGPTGRAIKFGIHCLANDIINNPEMIPWRENAMRLGYKSSAAFPIKAFGKTVGAFMLYSDEQFFFNETEVKLLDEMAIDISFAIEFNENEIQRERNEKEIRRLNAELEQRVTQRTAQLEASNKELEAFSYSVSHDLRAPLRHASGYVELLIKKCKSDLSEKGQHYLTSIAESVHQMGMLIDDLLQFSRTGRTEMRESNSDMNNLLQEVIESLKSDNKNRQIEWNTCELPQVFCDGAMLKLVWINLLSNAIKFTKTRDKAKIEIGVKEENSEFIFHVKDNGVGFDMKYAQKLFGVFQRLHSMDEFEGTGIGLANVRRIIGRHGGRTWAEAELDKGAAFYFTLPKKL